MTRGLDTFSKRPRPFPAAPFPEAELLQVAGPGGLASGRRTRPLRPLLEPGPQLRLLGQVRIEAGDPLPDHDQAAEHLESEVPGVAPGDLRELPLRFDPGTVPLGTGAADLLVGVPDPLEAAWVQRAERCEAGLEKRGRLL